jgi:hypothetical protein
MLPAVRCQLKSSLQTTHLACPSCCTVAVWIVLLSHLIYSALVARNAVAIRTRKKNNCNANINKFDCLFATWHLCFYIVELRHLPHTLSLSRRYWSGVGAPITQLHYDSRDNLVCVAAGGWKTFRLVDPVQSAALLYSHDDRDGNTSPVRLDDPVHTAAEYVALPS